MKRNISLDTLEPQSNLQTSYVRKKNWLLLKARLDFLLLATKYIPNWIKILNVFLKAIMFKTNLGHKTLKNLHITLLVMCNLLHFSVFPLSIYLLYTFVKVCQVSWFSLPYSYCTLRGSSLQ